ncbi:SDR family NAD(P)-dependent oxidoreductase [Micromonospora krabiensis]|uniref:Meso-butanediol dehydrogenase / (S,S)-butanediol dehydrogenase / diacetyl reductase n=1 Tax=Micromonospora krabiensis TaxID=307121 RepID=A0A1C3NDW3_9ACTN|nr:SDR family NAD(P)-dependent oxidoreductase [Micromonospora krabiensis]SBV30728.1 meso-butanediol dehydrogenase / (S,S)-butanediol dehydrogenase / diacetyl reductase [Micromonospora krabiensis]
MTLPPSPSPVLAGRRAVVSGGAAGIGEAVAARLVGDGASVLVADVDAAAGRATARRLGATFVEVDLSELDGVRAMMDAAVQQWGGIDILVNNAGGVTGPAYPVADADRWIRSLDLNLRGVLLSCQLALEAMPRGGAIINVASVAGLGHGVHGVPEYAVAKAGVIRLTACLAPLRDRLGIRVNCVCPDLVDTPASRRDRETMTPAARARTPPAIPATEIADAVATLLTDDTLAGRVLVCQAKEPRRLLLPADGWSDHVNRLG